MVVGGGSRTPVIPDTFPRRGKAGKGAGIAAAPESFQAEIREVLSAMVETDPHLSSLARALDT
jgi:hypothetical protein